MEPTNLIEVGDFYPIDGVYRRCVAKSLDSVLFEGEVALFNNEIKWEQVKLESEVL